MNLRISRLAGIPWLPTLTGWRGGGDSALLVPVDILRRRPAILYTKHWERIDEVRGNKTGIWLICYSDYIDFVHSFAELLTVTPSNLPPAAAATVSFLILAPTELPFCCWNNSLN